MDQKKRKTRQTYNEKEKTIIKNFLDGQPEGKKYFRDREIKELMNKLDEASGQRYPQNSVRQKLRAEMKKRQLVAEAKKLKKKGPKTLWRIINEYVKERMSKLKKQNERLKDKARNYQKMEKELNQLRRDKKYLLKEISELKRDALEMAVIKEAVEKFYKRKGLSLRRT